MFANKLPVRSLFPRGRGGGGGISPLPLRERHHPLSGAQERDNSRCPLDSVCSLCQRDGREREAILGTGVWAESSLESSLGINVVRLLVGRARSSLALRAILALSDLSSPPPTPHCFACVFCLFRFSGVSVQRLRKSARFPKSVPENNYF